MSDGKPSNLLPAAHSMSTRLALIGIVVAGGLSLLVSCVIVAADAWDERTEIKQHTDVILDTWERSAAEAAFHLDEQLSAQIVSSIGMSRDVRRATITSDLGEVLATWDRKPEDIGFLAGLVVGDDPLLRDCYLFTSQRDAPVGKLAITFSPGRLYEPVISRARRTFASAISQSVLLAIALWVVTNNLLARPLRCFIEALAKVNIEAPTALGDRFSARTMSTELGLLNRTADTILTSTADLLDRHDQAREELLASEQRFEAFAGAASDWFWETGPESELLYLSDKYEAVTGFQCAPLMGRPFVNCVCPSAEERRPETADHLVKALRLRQPFRDLPIETQSAGGADLFLCYSGVPQYTQRGEFLGFRGAVRNATPENEWDRHRRFLTESLNHAEKLKMIGQLTAGVAHDFNNLLGAIQANIELLAIGWGDSSEQREAVANAVKRGSLLTKRLLTYSQHQQLSPSSVEVKPLLSAVVELLSRVIGEQVDFQYRVGDDVGHCYADRGQLESVLINLCINARDAMPTGGRLTVAAERFMQRDSLSNSVARGEYVCFSVQDDGVGMDEQTLSRATEPFFTTKPVGTGTGLGLSMAVGFADQSHGSFTIDSAPGEGTTVRLCLPSHGSPESPVDPAPSMAAGLPPGLRVLVVEDDDAVQRAIEAHLRSMSCEVVCASDGPAALDFASSGAEVDVLLIDMVLPGGLSGLELAERLANLLPTAKQVFMSGYSKDLAQHRPIKPDVNVLEKPFGRGELSEKILACIGEPVVERTTDS